MGLDDEEDEEGKLCGREYFLENGKGDLIWGIGGDGTLVIGNTDETGESIFRLLPFRVVVVSF
jgi:hypothetical protein